MNSPAVDSVLAAIVPARLGDYRPIWRLTAEELAAYPITPYSQYRDLKWRVPVTTPGGNQTDATVNWDLTLHDGSRLSQPRHVQRLGWAKKLMALVLKAPASGVVPSPASMSSFQQGFRWLISWMAERGLQRPDEFDQNVFDEYIEDLPRFIAEWADDEEITQSQVTRALYILSWLWSERRLMTQWGVPTLSFNPFRERWVDTYAQSIATKTRGWIPPLPDEVAIPLFNTAAGWLGQPAEDVIRLVEAVTADPLAGKEVEVSTRQSRRGLRRQKAGSKKVARRTRAHRILASYRFGTVPGALRPWHAPLDDRYEEAHGETPLRRLRALFDAVREACALTVLGQTGMRMSELLGIEAGIDMQTGLPSGVRIEASATGLYDVFLLRTVLSKTEEGLPREMDWVLGLRPTGTVEEPLPVRALRLLDRLHAPWRQRAKTTRLLIASNVGSALPLKTKALGEMPSDRMRHALKRFIANWVDLSGLPDESRHKIKDNDLREWRESKGGVFTSYMLRKAWAQFMFATDPRLMPAIQLQFHHLSMAMTDTGYIGANPLIVRNMDTVATQARNIMMLEMVLGRNPFAGKMGEQMEQATRDLAANAKDLPTSEAYKTVVKFCDDIQLPIFFSPHGACMPLRVSKMRCHDEAETPVLLRKQPNARTRQPSLCIGCDCFVLDARHAGFWASRYLDNWLAYKRAERSGDVTGYKVIKERAQQAGKLLKKIGVKVAELDRQIDQTLEAEYAPA